jgi:hypothetical protein
LVKNGIPFDVAFALSPEESLAYAVIFGQMENPKAEYDFDMNEWISRD